jgi:hypothetical protein
MRMKTDQVNIRLPKNLIDWIDSHPLVAQKGYIRTPGRRTRVIERLVEQAMKRLPDPSASNQHDSQGDGLSEP